MRFEVNALGLHTSEWFNHRKSSGEMRCGEAIKRGGVVFDVVLAVVVVVGVVIVLVGLGNCWSCVLGCKKNGAW